MRLEIAEGMEWELFIDDGISELATLTSSVEFLENPYYNIHSSSLEKSRQLNNERCLSCSSLKGRHHSYDMILDPNEI